MASWVAAAVCNSLQGLSPSRQEPTRANVWPGNAAVAGEGTAPFEGRQSLECKWHCSSDQLYFIRVVVAYQKEAFFFFGSAKGDLVESHVVVQEKAAPPRGLTWTQAFRGPVVDTELQMLQLFPLASKGDSPPQI